MIDASTQSTPSYPRPPTRLVVVAHKLLIVAYSLLLTCRILVVIGFGLAKMDEPYFSRSEIFNFNYEYVGTAYFYVLMSNVVVFVLFLIWKYKANAFCRHTAAGELRFTSLLSIAYYFIPVWNVIRPYQAMKEIWQASISPENWKQQKIGPLLPWWWAVSLLLLLIHIPLSNYARFYAFYELYVVALGIDHALRIVMHTLTIQVISAIDAHQKKHLRSISTT